MKEYLYNKYSLNNATISLKKRIKQAALNRGEIINLSISGTNKKRNDAILNTLIRCYRR